MRSGLRAGLLYLLLSISLTGAEIPELPGYRFALMFGTEELLSDPARREAFITRFLQAGAAFHAPDVSYDAETGATYGGTQVDFRSGEALGPVRRASTPSNEALHFLLCGLAVSGNARAQSFLAGSAGEDAKALALGLLEKKTATLERFDREFTAFAGFLPWFEAQGGRIVPAKEWEGRIPATDNGQLAWALIHAEFALREAGQAALAERVRARHEKMAANFERVFFEALKMRAIAGIANLNISPEDSRQFYYWSSIGDENQREAGGTDESELALLFATLRGRWSDPAIPARLWEERRLSDERGRRQARVSTARGGIAMQMGFRQSAREQWPALQFPYLDHPLIRRVFENGERYRTQFAAESLKPGLIASAHEPVTENTALTPASALGIPGPGSRNPAATRTDVLAPHAAFPAILAQEATGAAYLHAMLLAPKAQTPFGAVEAIAAAGGGITPLVTWDGNATLALAFAINEEYAWHGQHFMSRVLQASGLYSEAMALLQRDFFAAFPSLTENPPALEGEHIPFASPAGTIPETLKDYHAEEDSDWGSIFAGTPFSEGTGGLLLARTFDRSQLTMPAGTGTIQARFRRVPLDQKPWLLLRGRAARGWIGFEIRNELDQPAFAQRRCYITLPDSQGMADYAIDLRPALARPDLRAAALWFADLKTPLAPEGFFEMQGLRFAEAPPPGSAILGWDGASFRLNPEESLDVLSTARPTGGGSLTVRQATSGNITLPLEPANLATRSILSFEAMVPGGLKEKFLLEFKNAASRDILENPKIMVELPIVSGYQRYHLDLSAALMDPESIAVAMRFFEPSAQFVIRSIQFRHEPPTEPSIPLHFDTRRFVANPRAWSLPTPFQDVLRGLNFVPGFSMQHVQEHDLLLPTRGIVSAWFPSIIQGEKVHVDLLEKPFLSFIYTADRACTLNVEVKDARDQIIAGHALIFNYYKYVARFPKTENQPRLITFDLRPEIRREATNRPAGTVAKITVLSDPEPSPTQLRLMAMGFSAEPPSTAPQVSMAAADGKAHLFFYNGTLQAAPALEGPWLSLTNATNGFQTPLENNQFFRLFQPQN